MFDRMFDRMFRRRYFGNNLISINPFKKLPIYAKEFVRIYKVRLLPPLIHWHIHCIVYSAVPWLLSTVAHCLLPTLVARHCLLPLLVATACCHRLLHTA